MTTNLDMQTELISRLNATGSSFYTLPRVKSALNLGKIRAEARHKWSALEDAATTRTQASLENYDYPDAWRSNALTRIVVNGELYRPKTFETYQNFKMESNPPPDPKLRIYAEFNRQFFLFPVPLTAPALVTDPDNIFVWGIRAKTPDMVADGDTTIFSYTEEEGNEAIVKLALSILLAKGKDKKSGQVEENEGNAILDQIWIREVRERQKDQILDHPRFAVPNLFPTGNILSRPGNFNGYRW